MNRLIVLAYLIPSIGCTTVEARDKCIEWYKDGARYTQCRVVRNNQVIINQIPHYTIPVPTIQDPVVRK